MNLVGGRGLLRFRSKINYVSHVQVVTVSDEYRSCQLWLHARIAGMRITTIVTKISPSMLFTMTMSLIWRIITLLQLIVIQVSPSGVNSYRQQQISEALALSRDAEFI